ncbi:MAG: hypothetical protein Q7J57_00750 [Gemmobacter sp.]|nr:hypothetical protein [Gemmobacter sp.]
MGQLTLGLTVPQSLALGVVALTLGVGLILPVKNYFSRRVRLGPVSALVLTGIIVVVGVLASGLDVRVALNVEPATALGADLLDDSRRVIVGIERVAKRYGEGDTRVDAVQNLDLTVHAAEVVVRLAGCVRP